MIALIFSSFTRPKLLNCRDCDLLPPPLYLTTWCLAFSWAQRIKGIFKRWFWQYEHSSWLTNSTSRNITSNMFTSVQKEVPSRVFIETLFATVKNWNRWPAKGAWSSRWQYIHIRKYWEGVQCCRKRVGSVWSHTSRVRISAWPLSSFIILSNYQNFLCLSLLIRGIGGNDSTFY